jgi:hypothetical protein
MVMQSSHLFEKSGDARAEAKAAQAAEAAMRAKKAAAMPPPYEVLEKSDDNSLKIFFIKSNEVVLGVQNISELHGKRYEVRSDEVGSDDEERYNYTFFIPTRSQKRPNSPPLIYYVMDGIMLKDVPGGPSRRFDLEWDVILVQNGDTYKQYDNKGLQALDENKLKLLQKSDKWRELQKNGGGPKRLKRRRSYKRNKTTHRKKSTRKKSSKRKKSTRRKKSKSRRRMR